MATALATTTVLRPSGQCDKLHVVYGVLSLELGGLERVVVDLVRECMRRGHLATVVCIEQRGRLASTVEDAGGAVYCLNKPPGRCQRSIAQTASLVHRLQPDVIHTHQIGALWYLGKAARPLGIPVVHTEHSDHIAHARGWVAKLRAWLRWRQAAPLADRFCCVSDDIATAVRRWRAVSTNRVEVVVNGIDQQTYQGSSLGIIVRTALGIPAGALVIGTVGRLVEVKRQDLLLRAFATLHRLERHANTWLLLVGDGPERKRLESQAQQLGVAARTVFAGYQSQPERYLQAMDLFALTSRHEGLPLVLLEAWASGLPVVASAVGGIPQTVEHGVTGLLFESGDQTALAETLEGLLDSGLMGRLGRQGQMEVERRYSLRRMADDYEAHYQRLARRGVREPV